MSRVSSSRPSADTPAGERLRGLSVSGVVTRIDPIADRMRRIRIEGVDIDRLAWVPGQHVRVHVTNLRDPRNWLRPGDMLRTYSVWDHSGGLELCVLDHGGGEGGGPGARWARQLRSGHEVTFGKPEGNFVLRDGAYHVFAGDETAAVAFGPMLRALPAGAPAYGVVEAGRPGDRLPLGEAIRWQYREGRPAASSQTLVDGLAALDLPDEPGIAYLAGEARTIQLLRRHLIADRGWPRQSIRTKPFWTPGKRGLD